MTTARIGSVKIEYEIIGEGEPILLIMGLSNQLIHWPDDFVSLLADRGFQVIRFDNRDIGLSTKMKGKPPTLARTIGALFSKRFARSDYLLADMANDAAGLLDHLGLPRAHVVGVSMGGMIAQSVAIGHPSKVASLTSIMSNTGNRRHGRISMGLVRKMPKYLKPVGDELHEVRAKNAVMVDRLVSGSEFDESYATGMFHRAYERSYAPDGVARQMAAIAASPDRTEALMFVTAPTLVIHGLADPLVLPSGGLATARAIPRSRLLMFPEMGHDLPRSRWPEIVDAIVSNAGRAPIASVRSADPVSLGSD